MTEKFELKCSTGYENNLEPAYAIYRGEERFTPWVAEHEKYQTLVNILNSIPELEAKNSEQKEIVKAIESLKNFVKNIERISTQPQEQPITARLLRNTANEMNVLIDRLDVYLCYADWQLDVGVCGGWKAFTNKDARCPHT